MTTQPGLPGEQGETMKAGTCPKCLAHDSYTRYESDLYPVKYERLYRRCRVCGYGWSEPVADVALVEEAEREAEEKRNPFIEIGHPYVGYRIRKDGTDPEERGHTTCYNCSPPSTTYGCWEKADEYEDWVQSYRQALAAWGLPGKEG
jgi:hypothetical protein